MVLPLLGLVAAAMFTGAAFYVSVAEQPARLKLSPAELLREWKPAYHRGTQMQVPLVIAGSLLGAAAWWQNGSPAFLAAALAMIANLPWTLLVIFPTNRKLEATGPESANERTRALIDRWGKLHALRTLLGAVAVVFFVLGLAAIPPLQ